MIRFCRDHDPGSSHGLWPMLVVLLACTGAVRADTEDELLEMELADLLKIKIVSVSNAAESLRDAPAHVEILTGAELSRRGYRNLPEIFDDLPGMQVTRPYGTNYFLSYWRGMRQNVGVPYLLMLDGTPLNHLYYAYNQIMVALPLSSIERVEIVYGPASVVYGPNAMVGVINVITKAELAKDGVQLRSQLKAGSFDTQTVDATLNWRQDDWQLRATLRRESSQLDASKVENYEWTRHQYYADRRLWGGFLDSKRYGDFYSPQEHEAVDVRVSYADTELAVQRLRKANGYGTLFAADKAQNNVIWSEVESALQLRSELALGERFKLGGQLHARTSNVDNDSAFLEGYNVTDRTTGVTRRLLDFSYWQIETRASALQFDFDWQAFTALQINGGLNIERKDLQKANRVNYSAALTPEQVELDSFVYPARPDGDSVANNRIDTRDVGAYVLGRWTLNDVLAATDKHIFNLGLRSDDNSEYGRVNTVRGGYVAQYGHWTLKLLYGEAYQEPPPRVLYGGWRGVGDDPNALPVSSDTREAALEYANADSRLWLSVYHLQTDGSFASGPGTTINLGPRDNIGADLGVDHQLAAGKWLRRLRLWGYYSWLDPQEKIRQSDGSFVDGSPGDTSTHTLRLGATAQLSDGLELTLRARYIGARKTVHTNPIPEVDSYRTADLSLRWLPLVNSSLAIQLDILNVTDASYMHPGARSADAGNTPGYFDAAGVWRGSSGFQSSLHPQEGRGFFLNVITDYRTPQTHTTPNPSSERRGVVRSDPPPLRGGAGGWYGL